MEGIRGERVKDLQVKEIEDSGVWGETERGGGGGALSSVFSDRGLRSSS